MPVVRSPRLVLLGLFVASVALLFAWLQGRSGVLVVPSGVERGEEGAGAASLDAAVRSPQEVAVVSTPNVELAAPDYEHVQRVAYPDKEGLLLQSLRPIDAILLDRARREPAPFMDVVVVDVHGVMVRARSGVNGRVVSTEVLPKGPVAVVLKGGPALPVWYLTGGDRNQRRESPPELCRFELEHGVDDAWADVWLIDSSRLVPIRLRGVPETKPEILLCTDSYRVSAVIEVSDFDDPESPFWRKATHVIALRSGRGVKTDEFFARVLKDDTGLGFGYNADAPPHVVHAAPWTAEFASHNVVRPRAALFTETKSLMRAATIRRRNLPKIGDEPLDVTFKPLTRATTVQLKKRFGHLAGWAENKLQQRAARLAAEQRSGEEATEQEGR